MTVLIVILIIAAALAAAEWKFSFMRTAYDAKKLPHCLIALLSVLLSLMSVPLFLSCFADARDDVPYPLEAGVKYYNPYVQQFDALRKGQLYLDMEVDERLLELDNPYDYQARQKSRADAPWDRALYDGKYYSYFGIAPVFAVYYPYWLIKGALPGESTVMAVYLFITALFLPLALFKWAESTEKKIPLVPLLLAVPAVFLSSAVLLVARGYAHFYYIAVIAGIAYLSAFLFFSFAAYTAKSRAAKCALWAAAGISYALIFLSRLNIAFLAAFSVVPGLWFMILRRDGKWRKLRTVATELACLGAPVAAAVGFSMWFNAARFSGPFDFGANYQLTVADVSTYRLRISDLPYAIYNYFLAPADACENYPYITFTRTGVSPSHYVYRDANLGLFCFPLTLGILTAPVITFSQRAAIKRRVMTGTAFFGLLVLAWFDFCKGGVIYRYTADIALMASFLAAASLLYLLGSDSEIESKKDKPALSHSVLYAAICGFFMLSAVLALRVSLINGHTYISDIPEKVLEIFEKILPFAKTVK